MSVAIRRPETSAPTPASHAGASSPWVEFTGLGWKGYSRLLKLRGDRAYPRMVYLDGTVYLMSPAPIHEIHAERFGMFVTEVATALDVPFMTMGRTTFRDKAKRGGVEGDKTFYFANAHRIRGRMDFNEPADPPPDLAIEAINTHGPNTAIRTYRRLGVPEVWTGDADEVLFLVLQPNGRYARAETSLALPFLTPADVAEWIHKPYAMWTGEWLKALRQWITETLAPRVQPK